MSDYAENLQVFPSEISNAVRRAVNDAAHDVLRGVDETYGVEMSALLPARIGRVVVKHLLRHKPEASASEVTEFVKALHADDLCLVIACEQGSEAAWRTLMTRFAATVNAAARTVAGRNQTDADDLAQSVWAELHGLRTTRTNDSKAEHSSNRTGGKLAYYSGCGSLGGYLRAVVAQLGTDVHRRTARLIQPDEQTDFDHFAHDGAASDNNINRAFQHQHATTLDPEAAFAQQEQATILRQAFTRSVATLAAEDALLIKLYYTDGLRLKEAGLLLGVHEATASRRLARIHATLRDVTEDTLRREYRWTPHDIASAFDALTGATIFDVQTFLPASNNSGDAQDAPEAIVLHEGKQFRQS
ncbi:MAG: sigma-70 family RNA polymerase sigma factor [Pyrinomonadaceae bacterium MAG19_C2-C3]|nr:sigma-70 family RNA polymerase sigma factor [Pyrinomonadaceae bacterium MAG19_C2-C3]